MGGHGPRVASSRARPSLGWWAGEIGALAPLVALWALLFRRILRGGEVLLGGEIHEWFYPFHRFVWDEIRSGRGFPLWDPYSFFGYPFAAAAQGALFYPPNLLLGLAGRIEWGLSLSIALHLLLAALLMYAFARAGLRLGRAAAVGAAAAYGLNGHMLANVEQLHNHATLAWIPLVLLAIERALAASRASPGSGKAARDGKHAARAGWLGLAGIALGLSLLGGMVQQSYYFGILLVFYVASRSWPDWRARGPARAAGRLGMRLGILFGVGVGLWAIQLLPAAELASEAARSSLTYEEAVSGPGARLTIADAFGLLVLNLGDWGKLSALNVFHVGLVPVAIALWMGARGLGRAGRGGVERFFVAAAAASIAVAAAWKPVLGTLWKLPIPGFGLFYDPARATTVLLLAVAILWARGLDEVARRDSHVGAAAGPAPVRGPIAALVLSIGILLALGLWARSTAEGAVGPAREVAGDLDLPDMTACLGIALGAGVLAMGGVVAARAAAGAARIAAPWILVLAGMVPLWVFGEPYVRTTDEARASGWIEGPSHVRRIVSEEGGSRLYRMANLDADEIATDPFENEFRVPTPTGFSSLIPRRVLAFTGVEWRDDAKRHTAHLGFLRYPSMRDLAACRYLVSRPDGVGVGTAAVASDPGMEPLGSADGYALFQNASALPRAFLAGSARTVGGAAEALAALKDPGFDPTAQVVIERAFVADAGPGGDPAVSLAVWTAGAEILEDEPGRLRVRVASGSERAGRDWLVLADTFYPGWVAEVDGRPATIEVANLAFRAVRLPADAREVAFTYAPASFRLGAVLSMAAAALALLLVALGLRRREKRGE